MSNNSYEQPQTTSPLSKPVHLPLAHAQARPPSSRPSSNCGIWDANYLPRFCFLQKYLRSPQWGFSERCRCHLGKWWPDASDNPSQSALGWQLRVPSLPSSCGRLNGGGRFLTAGSKARGVKRSISSFCARGSPGPRLYSAPRVYAAPPGVWCLSTCWIDGEGGDEIKVVFSCLRTDLHGGSPVHQYT
ncbi:hypothetical protein BGW80DRAFT_1449035 [Lactifluus volemus]|nr:hypothetical protein BGW80DRAFT_1449035 [Lactifluus volemus]